MTGGNRLRNLAFPFLIGILVLKALVLWGIIYFSKIGLTPDEAQYWSWGQALDWGYYSKPPGIAWLIRAGTTLFGNTEPGVRFFSPIISFCLSLAVFGLSRTAGLSREGAFWAALIMALTPLGFFSGFFATTDGPMVLFWTLALWVIIKGIEDPQGPSYALLGALIGLGALFKWPIFLLWIFVLLLMIFFASFRCPKFFLGLFLSLLGLLPSLIWNFQHGWPTFLHVGSTLVQPENTPPNLGNFWEFLGAQIVFLSPIFFICLLLAWTRLASFRRSLLTLGLLSLTLLGLYQFLSIFKKMQGNWCVFAYPAAIVFLSGYLSERTWGKRAYVWGILLAVSMSLVAFSLPFIPFVPLTKNPFKESMGWHELSNALLKAGYDPKNYFLFSDTYQMTALLHFYGPGQKRAYFFNLEGRRHNQFSYWPSMKERELHRTGYFVKDVKISTPGYMPEEFAKKIQGRLTPFFEKITFRGFYPLIERRGFVEKGVFIFECQNYLGGEPKETKLF